VKELLQFKLIIKIYSFNISYRPLKLLLIFNNSQTNILINFLLTYI